MEADAYNLLQWINGLVRQLISNGNEI